jgi:hypothetical protein
MARAILNCAALGAVRVPLTGMACCGSTFLAAPRSSVVSALLLVVPGITLVWSVAGAL